MDELKKPLDDTRSIINEFASGRQVPTVLALAQAEAIRDTIRALEHDTAKCDGRLAALKQRYPDPRALTPARPVRCTSTPSRASLQPKSTRWWRPGPRAPA